MKKELIRKYLGGNCNANEEKLALNILSTNEGVALLNELADEVWESDPRGEKIDSKRLYKKIEQQLPKKKIVLWPYLRYAAAVLILALAFGYFSLQNDQRTLSNAPAEIAFITKSTTAGQKSTVILPDGSKVILNSQSSIRYPKYFTDSTRNVELQGEAFFEVAPDAKRPFTVLSREVKTQALGTSFNINSRKEIIKISLATGKVKVDAEVLEEGIVLEPGFALSIHSEKDIVEKRPFDIKKELSWKEGILYFKDNSFNDIISTLELWYDVKFEIPASVKISAPYTGHFDNASLEHVLDNMGFALNFDYKMEEKKVKLINKP